MPQDYEIIDRDPKLSVAVEGFNRKSGAGQLIALDIQNKSSFLEENGKVFHEYELPPDVDNYYLGGYAGKVVYYRDPALLKHF